MAEGREVADAVTGKPETTEGSEVASSPEPAASTGSASRPGPRSGPEADARPGGPGRPVELSYLPTVGELTSALRARARSTGAGRRQSRLLAFMVICLLVAALLSSAGSSRNGSAPPWHLYAPAVFFAAFAQAIPWLQARRFHTLAVRQGDIRGTVDDTGVRLTTAHGSTSFDWHVYPRYVETPEVFVLLSADKASVGFAALPKRGVTDPADVDRVRAFLDRHLVRADAADASPGTPRSLGGAVGRGFGSAGLALLGLLLILSAPLAVQSATDPAHNPGLQENNAPISVVLLVTGLLATVGAWWLVRRMKVMRIVAVVVAALLLVAAGATAYEVAPMLHCWGSQRIAREHDGAYTCYGR